MSILIISGGRVDIESAAEYIKNRSWQHVIAVDGGLLAAQKLGLASDYIVGDFDTLLPEQLAPYETRQEVQIRRFVPEKDDTDTQIAIQLAISLMKEQEIVCGASEGKTTAVENDSCANCMEKEAVLEKEVILLGAIGSRMDHTLANLCLLQQFMRAGIPAYAVDANNRISVHETGFRLRRENAYGPYLSFVAMTPEVTGLTLTGLKYPLVEHTLYQASSLCVSNEYAAEEAEVQFERGILLMIEAKD